MKLTISLQRRERRRRRIRRAAAVRARAQQRIPAQRNSSDPIG